MAEPIKISTLDELNQLITSTKYVILDFWAEWYVVPPLLTFYQLQYPPPPGRFTNYLAPPGADPAKP